ncbi:MAG: septation protein IspZ [Neisseria sp.]|nr:septation protein IspZ [Neisseria sp.]
MKVLGKILLVLASLAYPPLWYYGREGGAFFWLAAAMCVLWLVRAAMPQTRAQRAVALVLAFFFAAVPVLGRPDFMYWYPVVVNVLMLAVFGGSLFAGQTVVERLARLQHPDLPPRGVRHTRRVTLVWCGFFVFNGAAAAILAGMGRYDWWAVYTGAVSYGLMGLLFAGEWVYRKVVLKV